MITLPTAKILLYIALTVGPANPTAIYATSPSENYSWTAEANGWHLTALGFPTADFSRDPSKEVLLSEPPRQSEVPRYVREISSYNWRHNTVVVLANGNRVEKRGRHVFYIINPGGPNEKDFTIFYNGDVQK